MEPSSPSRIANALISCLTGVPLHDYGCTLKAMSGKSPGTSSYMARCTASFRLWPSIEEPELPRSR